MSFLKVGFGLTEHNMSGDGLQILLDVTRTAFGVAVIVRWWWDGDDGESHQAGIFMESSVQGAGQSRQPKLKLIKCLFQFTGGNQNAYVFQQDLGSLMKKHEDT